VVPQNPVVLDDRDRAIPARANWIAQAACAGVDPDLFFPSKGEASDAAKALCAGCPVKGECLAFALDHHCQGIWGGTSERERARLRRGGVSPQRRR
jgi:WhiB family redox-sensing transcriptional regulator